MKVVINTQHGGFGLSRAATRRFAELTGRACYFFTHAPGKIDGPYLPVKDSDPDPFCTYAFDIPNPNEVITTIDATTWATMTLEERKAHNALYRRHAISDYDIPRDDAALLQVVEEMGSRANGRSASLHIVEIPDGVEWEVEEYDGKEWIAERHRTWS